MMPTDYDRLDPIDPPDDLEERYADFFGEHCREGTFFNPWNEREKPPFTDLLKWQLSSNPYRDDKKRESPVSPDRSGLEDFEDSDAELKIVWLGHASFLVEIDELRCLIDPVWGTLGAFVKRFSEEPYQLEELPAIDAVFVTHGHYDHLDTDTLERAARRWPEAVFFAPLGQGDNLPSACEHIVELDWWDRVEVGGVEAALVPMQHWHRRSLFDEDRALWGGWVLGARVLHAGDTGYCEVFEVLGELFELEVAILPVGAYEPRWFMKMQHMNPEEALQAFEDLDAGHMVGMHWGTYDLTDEPLNLGAERAAELADERDVRSRVHLPRPGGMVDLDR
jgi:L-ascorbate metabolism protein UlaG (beta-lactamase superfamily)